MCGVRRATATNMCHPGTPCQLERCRRQRRADGCPAAAGGDGGAHERGKRLAACCEQRAVRGHLTVGADEGHVAEVAFVCEGAPRAARCGVHRRLLARRRRRRRRLGVGAPHAVGLLELDHLLE